MGHIWIGTEGGGLDFLNKDEFGQISFTHYSNDSANPRSLSNNIVESICKDSHNNLWVGTNNGLTAIIMANENTNINENYFVWV